MMENDENMQGYAGIERDVAALDALHSLRPQPHLMYLPFSVTPPFKLSFQPHFGQGYTWLCLFKFPFSFQSDTFVCLGNSISSIMGKGTLTLPCHVALIGKGDTSVFWTRQIKIKSWILQLSTSCRYIPAGDDRSYIILIHQIDASNT